MFYVGDAFSTLSNIYDGAFQKRSLIRGAMHDLVLFAQIKKRENTHPMEEC